MKARAVAGAGDRGSAVVEFVLFAVVAIVPLAWCALALQQLAAVHQAAHSAAGESLRAFLTAPSEGTARQRADLAAQLALADHAAVKVYDLQVSCAAARCLEPGAAVSVRLRVQAELPQIPVVGVTPSVDLFADQHGAVDAFVAVR